MKKRIQIDTTILGFVILLTGFLCAFPRLYPQDRLIDYAFDFLGVISIFKGIFLRMAARGHKKNLSKAS